MGVATVVIKMEEAAVPDLVAELQEAMNSEGFEGLGATMDNERVNRVMEQCKQWHTRKQCALAAVEADPVRREEFRLDDEAVSLLQGIVDGTGVGEERLGVGGRYIAMLRLREAWYARVRPEGLLRWSDKLEVCSIVNEAVSASLSLKSSRVEASVPIVYWERQRDPPSSEKESLERLRGVCGCLLATHPEGLVLKPAHSCRSRGLVVIRAGGEAVAMHD